MRKPRCQRPPCACGVLVARYRCRNCQTVFCSRCLHAHQNAAGTPCAAALVAEVTAFAEGDNYDTWLTSLRNLVRRGLLDAGEARRLIEAHRPRSEQPS